MSSGAVTTGSPSASFTLLGEAYEWLGQAFLREPDGDEVRAFLDGQADLPDLLAGSNRRVVAAQEMLAEVRRDFSGRGPEQAELDLAALYARLFVGPHRERVSPYESVHVPDETDAEAPDSGPLLMGPSVPIMRALYAVAGVEPVNPRNLPEDHIGLELAFAGWLLSEEGRSHEDGAELLRLVVGDHLARWVPSFAQQIEEMAPRSYYAAIAQMALGLIEFHAGTL